MKDNDIIKALECLHKRILKSSFAKYVTETEIMGLVNALDLINRQKAEIERLETEIDKQYEQARVDILGNMSDGGTSCHWCIEHHRNQVTKEFAERLKEKALRNTPYGGAVDCVDIDNFIKEMTEGNENE